MVANAMLVRGMLASAAWLAISAGVARADDDAYMQKAKAFLQNVAAPVTQWDGPTSGPKAQGKKLIVIVVTDGRNGGAQGAADGAAEAAKALGWEVRMLDGQGTVPGRATAMTQALAMKPNGILNAGIDSKEQEPLFEQAAAAGVKVVGWHAGPKPGPDKDIPSVFTNVTTDPAEVAASAGYEAVVHSKGTAGVILFTDSIYAIAMAKTALSQAAVEGCKGCKVLEVVDTPIGDLSNRMGQLTTSLLSKYGKKWTYSIAVNDLYYDFSAPSLESAGVDPATGTPLQISSGDGSEPAFKRIRDKQYQLATVAEPLNLQGWIMIDEINRAFAGEKPSGYVPHVHLFTAENVDKDGGAENKFDPGNNYRDEYKKIWGVK
jgi:ribose transport system substrate-binding protein